MTMTNKKQVWCGSCKFFTDGQNCLTCTFEEYASYPSNYELNMELIKSGDLTARKPPDTKEKEVSDGSTASYYELPKGAKELQDLISYCNMNAQIGEIFRACYRYGKVGHSPRLRDAKKIKFYIENEIKRLEKYGES